MAVNYNDGSPDPAGADDTQIATMQDDATAAGPVTGTLTRTVIDVSTVNPVATLRRVTIQSSYTYNSRPYSLQMATERAIDDYNAGPPPIPLSAATFTLVETLAALSVLGVVGTVAMSYLGSQTFLFAKNTSLNQSHASVRSELDRVTNELQQAQSPPILTDTSGVATGVTPAAGLQFDRLIGDPYVITYPGSPGLAATDTSVTVTGSTNVLASAPIPQPGDVLLIDPPNGPPIRAQVASVAAGVIDAKAKRQSITPNPCRPARSGDRLRNSPDTPPCRRQPSSSGGRPSS